MPQDEQTVRVLVGYDLKLVLARGDLRGQVHQLSIHLSHDRGLGQPAPDRFGDLMNCGIIRDVPAGTVWKFYDRHITPLIRYRMRIFYVRGVQKTKPPERKSGRVNRIVL
jgi:hypothetical protein